MISADITVAFREALTKARKDLEAAEEQKTALCNEELELGRELWQLQRLIDALELYLGETTEAEVFKRNKLRGKRK